MHGSLILRLVDVVLLLLLSLMAVASIRTSDVEPPVSQKGEAGASHLYPLQVALTPDGRFLLIGGTDARTITLKDLYEVTMRLEEGRIVEFTADRRSPARLLIEAGRVVQDAGHQAAFLVELGSEEP